MIKLITGYHLTQTEKKHLKVLIKNKHINGTFYVNRKNYFLHYFGMNEFVVQTDRNHFHKIKCTDNLNIEKIPQSELKLDELKKYMKMNFSKNKWEIDEGDTFINLTIRGDEKPTVMAINKKNPLNYTLLKSEADNFDIGILRFLFYNNPN